MSKNIEQYTGEEILGAVIDNSNRIADRQVYKSLGEFHETLREYAQPISDLAIEVQKGKEDIVSAVNKKGVTTSTNKTLSQIAGDITQIAQSPITIEGGEIYQKTYYSERQHDIIAIALTSRALGHTTSYTGMVCVRYYKTSGSILLNGASAYICSDNISLLMTESGITHIWEDDNDGYLDRYVIYLYREPNYICDLFASAISPIEIVVLGECKELVLNDVTLQNLFCPQINGQNNLIKKITLNQGESFGKNLIIEGYYSHEEGSIFVDKTLSGVVLVSFPQLETITGGYIFQNSIKNTSICTSVKVISMPSLVSIKNAYLIEGTGSTSTCGNLELIDLPSLREINNAHLLLAEEYTTSLNQIEEISLPALEVINNGSLMRREGVYKDGYANGVKLKRILLPSIKEINSDIISKTIYNGYITPNIEYFQIGAKGEKTQTIKLNQYFPSGWVKVEVDVEIGDKEYIEKGLEPRWLPCQNISMSVYNLTELNMINHILKRLKQDEEMCGSGVTITLGATNLAKLTSEEAVALLDSLTNTYGYTFA